MAKTTFQLTDDLQKALVIKSVQDYGLRMQGTVLLALTNKYTKGEIKLEDSDIEEAARLLETLSEHDEAPKPKLKDQIGFPREKEKVAPAPNAK